MKNKLIKLAVCIAVFFITIYLGINVFNQGNSDMTATMEAATFPVVHMVNGDIEYNALQGMITDVDIRFQRDTITPLEEGRSLHFTVNKHGNTVEGMSFELRNIDGTRLIEKTQVDQYEENDTTIQSTVVLKDLIEDNVEYNWILKLDVADKNGKTKTVNYYTRVINLQNDVTNEKLTYVSDFHRKTFDKEAAKEIANYLEPNRKADNTTYNKVDIHCSLSQVSWGELNVRKITTPSISIRETDEQTANIRIDYRVETITEDDVKEYNVREFYRIRHTKNRMYLLDFERKMNQIFVPDSNIYASNKIMLGIRDEQIQMKESTDGSNVAFVNEGQLICYHAADKKMAYVFSFYDDLDERTLNDNYGIKILSVDETGNVTFIVYGYMSRGRHEGEMGIQIYQYYGMMNQIEELAFIPYSKTFDILASDIDRLSYKNKNGVVYLYLDGTVMAVNSNDLGYTPIATKLSQGSFKVSDSNEMLVWQNESNSYDCTKLKLMNLNTGVTKEIIASGDGRLLPLGFIGEDLIYGVAHYEDILEDATGTVTFPMYAVYIQNESGEILKRYEPIDAYVVDSFVEDNLITLKRVKKDENNGVYIATTEDQIVNNVIEEPGHNSYETVVTQNYKTIIQLVLKNNIDPKNLKFVVPKEVLFDGSRDIDMQIEPIDRNYVYGKNGIHGTFTKISDAVNLAYDINGTVIDEDGRYLWRKVSRSTRNQIMKIKGRKSDENTSSLAVCIETMLEYKGYSISVDKMLAQKSVYAVLAEQLQDSKILELKGVSLDAILYYVNMDIPVLAMLNDGEAVLIVGFNELNIVVMDPTTGTVYKKGMNDAKTWLAENGNQFITYIDGE